MTRASQKATEREIVERLLSTIRLIAEIDADGEKPDIILNVLGRTIGLEVTTYRSSKTVSTGDKRKFAQRQVEAAWEELEYGSRRFRNKNADLKNIAIILGFKNIIPYKTDHDQFLVEINDFISLHKNALTENLIPYSFDQFTSPLMVKYLLYIAASTHESGKSDSNKTSGFVDRPAAAVARIIAMKAHVVKSYRPQMKCGF